MPKEEVQTGHATNSIVGKDKVVDTGSSVEEKIEDEVVPGDDSEFLPTCTNCFHKTTCYAYLSMVGKEEEFKQLKWVAMPFPPKALATTCTEYIKKSDVIDTTKVDKRPDEDHT